jgi:hypothetical protein
MLNYHHKLGFAFIIAFGVAGAFLFGRDHLVPIAPFDERQQPVFDMLIPREGWDTAFWMIAESGANSFAKDVPEYAVMVRTKPGKANSYLLEFVSLDHSITQHQMREGIQSLEFYKRSFKVTRKECQIDESLFELLRYAWIRVTKGTRVSDANDELYPPVLMYYVWPGLSGRTTKTVEITGVVLEFSEISAQLVKIVESNPKDRTPLVEECRAMAKTLVEASPDK